MAHILHTIPSKSCHLHFILWATWQDYGPIFQR